MVEKAQLLGVSRADAHVRSINFTFRNSHLIKLLAKRGSHIENAEFDKAKKVEN
jgi:hypothetical protein